MRKGEWEGNRGTPEKMSSKNRRESESKIYGSEFGNMGEQRKWDVKEGQKVVFCEKKENSLKGELRTVS